MKMNRILIAIFLLVTQLGYAQTEHETGVILAQFSAEAHPETTLKNYTEIHGINTGIALGKLLSKPMNIYKITFDATRCDEDFLLQKLRNDRAILNAQFNHFVYQRETTPNDPQLTSQWHHINNGDLGTADADIDSDQAWDITTGGVTALGDTIVVCVIEGGNLLHPDLIDNAWYNHHEIPDNGVDDDNNGYIDDYGGWNVANETDGGLYGNGHGTEVLGMIGATGNNNEGVTGINWNIKMMVVGGENANNEASVIEAYTYPLVQRQLYESSGGELGAFVVVTNASWGLDGGNPDDVPIWAAFYDTLGAYGILNCGATTNLDVNVDVEGDIPTAVESDYMISVTATNSNDERTFSGFGPETIDLGAPGESVVTTAGQNGTTSTTGTSYASPLTAGVVALLYAAPCEGLAQLAHENPQLCADYVRNALLTGVDPIENLELETVTGGRLNAFNSLSGIMENCATGFCVPPLNFDYTVVNDTIFTFSWVAPDSLFSSTIRYRLIGEDEWTYISDITVDSEQINGLEHCADYEFEIAGACNGEPQESDFGSNTVVHTAGCCVIPDDVVASSTEDIPLLLTWTQGLDIDAYLVWYQLEGDTSWVTGAAGSDFYAFTDLEECQTYNFRIIPTCFLGDDNYVEITLTTPGCGYCIDTEFCPSNSQTSFFEHIDSVQVGDYINGSGNDGGYAFFEDTGIELARSADYPIKLTPGFGPFAGYEEFFTVWIDFNQDGLFTTDEKLFESEAPTSNPSEGEITIPAQAILGPNRMRMVMTNHDNSSPGIEPCETYNYGETEDYCITIVDSMSSFSSPYLLGGFQLWPNPGNGNFTLNFTPSIKSRNGKYSAVIFDLRGKRLLEMPVSPGSNSLSTGLTPGLYLLQLKDADGENLKSQKLVITR